MTPEQFCYWLQGFVELTNSDKDAILDAPEWKMIKDHLKEVFHKKTPERGQVTAPNAPYQSPQAAQMPPYQFPNQGQIIC